MSYLLQQTPEASTESNSSSTTSAMSSSTTKETCATGALTESGSEQNSAQKVVFGVHTSSGRVPDQVVVLSFYTTMFSPVPGHSHGVIIWHPPGHITCTCNMVG